MSRRLTCRHHDRARGRPRRRHRDRERATSRRRRRRRPMGSTARRSSWVSSRRSAGLVSLIGIPLTAGNQLWWDYVNKELGGVGGKYKVKLVQEDSAYQPPKAHPGLRQDQGRRRRLPADPRHPGDQGAPAEDADRQDGRCARDARRALGEEPEPVPDRLAVPDRGDQRARLLHQERGEGEEGLRARPGRRVRQRRARGIGVGEEVAQAQDGADAAVHER